MGAVGRVHAVRVRLPGRTRVCCKHRRDRLGGSLVFHPKVQGENCPAGSHVGGAGFGVERLPDDRHRGLMPHEDVD